MALMFLIAIVPAKTLFAGDNVQVEFRAPPADQKRYTIEASDVVGAGSIAVVRGGEQKTSTTVAIVENPAITTTRYVVRGRVKYDNVTGPGYLEMLNRIDDQEYFSRTLGEFGTVKNLSGSSDWRDFELPFYSEPGKLPTRLTINVVLPGQGTVSLDRMELHAITAADEWWTPQASGLIGGIGGSIAGLLGAVIGVLAGMRRFKGVVISAISLGIEMGVLSLIVGLVAFCLRQPYHVTYPLILFGVISTFVLAGNVPQILKRYREDELRRMTALDA